MASAEAKDAYATKYCITQDFRMPPDSSDHPLSVSKKMESDWGPRNSANDHTNLGCGPHNPNSDRLRDMKWSLHVKTNMGDEAKYTRQHLNSWEAELGAFSAGFVDDIVKLCGDQSVKNLDALSCIGSANSAVEQSWNVSPTCVKDDSETRMPRFEAALNNDLQLTPKKKDQDFWFLDGHFVDWDITNFLASEPCARTSTDLKSQWKEAEKIGPWWRIAGKDELASLVAQKSLEHIDNCDLSRPQIKHIRKSSVIYPNGIDHDKIMPSSLNQKAQIGSSNVDSNKSGTTTSGCSLQDSDMSFSSSYSKDSDSSNKYDQIKSVNNSKAKLLEALYHSQTRAREAEKAAEQAYSEKEHILSLFFRQASQLFAYKQWFHILQLENLCLQLRNKNNPLLNLFPAPSPRVPCKGKQLKKSRGRAGKSKGGSRRYGIRKCAVAFAVGLGLAGAGLFLGWTMGWMFPHF